MLLFQESSVDQIQCSWYLYEEHLHWENLQTGSYCKENDLFYQYFSHWFFFNEIEGVYVFLDKCKERCTAVYTDIYTIITELYLDICLTKEPTKYALLVPVIE